MDGSRKNRNQCAVSILKHPEKRIKLQTKDIFECYCSILIEMAMACSMTVTATNGPRVVKLRGARVRARDVVCNGANPLGLSKQASAIANPHPIKGVNTGKGTFPVLAHKL